jgi:hypothetical protein
LSSDASVAAEASRPVVLARRARVLAIASAEFSLVERALGEFTLSTVPDARAVIGSSASGFRAADAYRLLHSTGCGPPLHDLNWDNFAPVKVWVFIWILRHRWTRTRARLHHLSVLGSPDCPFCSGVTEDVHHMFVACPHLLSVLRCASMTPYTPVPTLLKDMIDAFCGAHQNWPPLLRMTATTTLLWVTWKTRNCLVFNGVRHTKSGFFVAVRQHLLLWIVRAPHRVDCNPLTTWCALLSP